MHIDRTSRSNGAEITIRSQKQANASSDLVDFEKVKGLKWAQVDSGCEPGARNVSFPAPKGCPSQNLVDFRSSHEDKTFAIDEFALDLRITIHG